MSLIPRIAAIAIDIVYPPTCAGCDLRGTWLCDQCRASIAPLSEPVCDRCGAPRALGWCQCHLLDAHLDQVRSALPYQGWVAAAVGRFKYHDETARAGMLATILVDWLQRFGKVDGLVPVPLHPRRRRRRGYNQAELLATELGRETGVPVLTPLVRTRHTPPQVGSDADHRRDNVAGAFALRPDHALPVGGRLVLIDDVRTTGATLGACAKALAPSQPRWVGALTVAWTMPRFVERTTSAVDTANKHHGEN